MLGTKREGLRSVSPFAHVSIPIGLKGDLQSLLQLCSLLERRRQASCFHPGTRRWTSSSRRTAPDSTRGFYCRFGGPALEDI